MFRKIAHPVTLADYSERPWRRRRRRRRFPAVAIACRKVRRSLHDDDDLNKKRNKLQQPRINENPI